VTRHFVFCQRKPAVMSAKVEPQISGTGASKRQAPEEAPGLLKLLYTLFCLCVELGSCPLLL
jgi:hypothetical protein